MNIKRETHLSVDGRFLFVIVQDKLSGRRGRWTTHKIELFGLNRTEVVGRELTLDHSRRIAKNRAGFS